MKSEFYKLEDKKVVACKPQEWGFAITNKHVATDKIGSVTISTVFLGIDHSFGGKVPLVFETMVFGGELDGLMERYSTWDQAETGHKIMVEKVKNSRTLNPPRKLNLGK